VVSKVVIQGELQDRYEVQRLLLEAHPELHVDTVGTPWELLDRARGGEYAVALILKGPIARHQERVQAVASLKANGFAGRILYAGAFLTEKQDALQAGAHYAFDPDAQRAEEVVWAALYRPRVAVDHPYLRFLFVGEWLDMHEYDDVLPERAPDVLLTSTSRHGVPEFYGALAEFAQQHPETRCVLVEDDASDDVRVEALATGVQPYVVLRDDGLLALARLVGNLAQECWLSRF
jgi:hypothetical protein